MNAHSLRSIKLRGLLSFGWDAISLDLRDLNLLIGANGSGKSNLLEALRLLKNTTRNESLFDRTDRDPEEWVHSGKGGDGQASIEVCFLTDPTDYPLRYRLVFEVKDGRAMTVEEVLESANPDDSRKGRRTPEVYFKVENGLAVVRVGNAERTLAPGAFDPDRSILAQKRDIADYPQIAKTAQLFEQIALFQQWQFGPDAAVRDPQPARRRSDFLDEDARNLAVVIGKLLTDVSVKKDLIESLKSFYEPTRELSIEPIGQKVQLVLAEEHWSTPASRLSDGTLRWISLLAILLHPTPPPIVCLEEPELGLHPDLTATLARLLRDASTRCQIIATTHSPLLLSEFTFSPEDVVVFERTTTGATTLHRLDPAMIARSSPDEALGDLWASGEIGGNRW